MNCKCDEKRQNIYVDGIKITFKGSKETIMLLEELAFLNLNEAQEYIVEFILNGKNGFKKDIPKIFMLAKFGWIYASKVILDNFQKENEEFTRHTGLFVRLAFAKTNPFIGLFFIKCVKEGLCGFKKDPESAKELEIYFSR